MLFVVGLLLKLLMMLAKMVKDGNRDACEYQQA